MLFKGSSVHAPPNNRMQRCVGDKVLGRGRDTVSPKTVMRARVREALCTRADAGRWAT